MTHKYYYTFQVKVANKYYYIIQVMQPLQCHYIVTDIMILDILFCESNGSIIHTTQQLQVDNTLLR